jgi:hypothetical protein
MYKFIPVYNVLIYTSIQCINLYQYTKGIFFLNKAIEVFTYLVNMFLWDYRKVEINFKYAKLFH